MWKSFVMVGTIIVDFCPFFCLAILKFTGQYLEKEIRYQHVLCKFWLAWSNDDPQCISNESDLRPSRRCQKCVFQKIQNENPIWRTLWVLSYVGFDPKNVYNKFRVNRTSGVGVMNFKVEKVFSLIIGPPSGWLGSNYLGSIYTQLPNKVQSFMSLPFIISQEFVKTFLKKTIIINQHKNNRVSALQAWTPNNIFFW